MRDAVSACRQLAADCTHSRFRNIFFGPMVHSHPRVANNRRCVVSLEVKSARKTLQALNITHSCSFDKQLATMGLHLKETKALLKQFQNNQARFASDAMAIATSSLKKECFSTFLSIRQNFVDEICQEALQILHKEPLESVVANDGSCFVAVDVAAPWAEEELAVQSLEQDVDANAAFAEVASAPLAEETILFRSFEDEFSTIVEDEIAADPRAEVRLKAFAQFMMSGVVERAELAQKYVEFVRLS